jgi:hypothetical protein
MEVFSPIHLQLRGPQRAHGTINAEQRRLFSAFIVRFVKGIIYMWCYTTSCVVPHDTELCSKGDCARGHLVSVLETITSLPCYSGLCAHSSYMATAHR